jgi:hypothetical protein
MLFLLFDSLEIAKQEIPLNKAKRIVVEIVFENGKMYFLIPPPLRCP